MPPVPARAARMSRTAVGVGPARAGHVSRFDPIGRLDPGTRLRLQRDAALAARVLGLALLAYYVAMLVLAGDRVDAAAYYDARLPDPYAHAIVGSDEAYLYAPAFIQVLTPLQQLPWQWFLAIWSSVLATALAFLAGPWLAVVLLLIPVASELHTGNIHLLLAAAVVIGFRRPGAWAFVLLTKSTCGVGLLWFVVRREWRNLGIALGTTTAVAAVSFVAAPGLWFDWVHALLANTGVTVVQNNWLPIPLPIRVVAAAGLVAWGARRDQRWTVAVGALLALPVVWYASYAMLVACIPLLPDDLRRLRRGGDRFGVGRSAGANVARARAKRKSP